MLLPFRHQVTWSQSIHLHYSAALFLHIYSKWKQFCSNKHAFVSSHFSYVWLFLILWIIAQKAPLSMGFSRQEYWSGLLYPLPGHLPDLGIEPASLFGFCSGRQVLYTRATWKAPFQTHLSSKNLLISSVSHLPFVLCSGSRMLSFSQNIVP